MNPRIPVLVNKSGGTAAKLGDKLEDEVESAFADAKLEIDLHLLEGCDLPDAAKAFAREPVVVAGGGDGTLACVAQALLDASEEGRAPLFGILPVGTRNHLARELSIPLDLPGAAKLIAERPVRKIDVGRVNGELFVNNASVGLYPALVRRREVAQKRHGLPKWLAMAPAAAGALANLHNDRLTLATPEGDRPVRTPMLFVGNNRYALDAGRIGQRESLEDGKLSVYAVAEKSVPGLAGFALRTLVGCADPHVDFAALGEMASFSLKAAKPRIDVALDGEVRCLDLPLEFEIEAQALAVIAPPG